MRGLKVGDLPNCPPIEKILAYTILPDRAATVRERWLTPWQACAPSEGVRKSKPQKNAGFPQLEASLEALQRVLTGRLMIAYPPTGSGFPFSAIPHTFSGSGSLLAERQFRDRN